MYTKNYRKSMTEANEIRCTAALENHIFRGQLQLHCLSCEALAVCPNLALGNNRTNFKALQFVFTL